MEYQKLDMKEWMQLAKKDPQSFEKKRAEIIQQTISSSPHSKKRLEGLQWQIDQVRESTETPMVACRKISQMMWTNVRGENGLLDKLNQLSGRTPIKPKPTKLAKVLQLPLKSSKANEKTA